MENFFARYKNPLVLMAVLFIQVVALATQVKRQETARNASGGGTRLIRVWTVTVFSPVQKVFVSTGHFFRDSWHNYADLRGVRQQNKELKDEVARLQMEQARLKQDADQARRLQVLLDFKERYIGKTLAAQVIGTSGTEQSRVILIDKGAQAGLKTDMAVITPDGIVGKVKEVFPLSSQVLLINDRDSGAGVILEGSRLQGILKGTSTGELQITDIMSDEKVDAGERVVTSGGDRIFPKGLPVGTVSSSSPDRDNDPFLNVRIKPAADLRRLEEVMVVTRIADDQPAVATGTAPLRAADILSQRLPSVPKQDTNDPKASGATGTPSPAGPAPNKTNTAAVSSGTPKTPSASGSGQPATGVGPKKEVTPEGAKPPAPGASPGPSPIKSPAGAVKSPATAVTGQSGQTGQAGAPKSATETKSATEARKPVTNSKPASTGTAGGAATPTPTPKPKAPLKKPSPTPTPADTKSAPAQPPEAPPAATPTPTPETLPR